MKKVLIFGGCSLVLLYLLIRPFPEVTMLGVVESYDENWGITLPEPQRFEQIWATKYPARGDGEWASVLHYEELSKPTSKDFIQITSNNESVILGMVNRFKTNSINTYIGNKETQQQIREAFDKTPVEIAIGDYYFHQAKNGGNDYLIGVYSQAENKVYLLEWHQ